MKTGLAIMKSRLAIMKTGLAIMKIKTAIMTSMQYMVYHTAPCNCTLSML